MSSARERRSSTSRSAACRAMPAPGRGALAERLQFTPGGLANVALGLTRLVWRRSICSPVGDDVGGPDARRRCWPRRASAGMARVAERRPCRRSCRWTATAPSSTVDPIVRRSTATASPRCAPRAVVIDLPEVDRGSDRRAVYAVIGDFDARALAGGCRRRWPRRRRSLVNDSEAIAPDRHRRPRAGRGAGADRHCPTVVVTLADEGAAARVSTGGCASRRAVGHGRGHQRRRRPVHGRLRLGRPGRAVRSPSGCVWTVTYAVAVGARPHHAGRRPHARRVPRHRGADSMRSIPPNGAR